MHAELSETYRIYRLYESLRGQLMEVLEDQDLAFSPGGGNLTLGELCREIGEVEHSYIQSFKTFTQNFEYRNRALGLDRSLADLKAWFASLDADLETALEGLTEEDVTARQIDRGEDFTLPPAYQLIIYQEALLIFYGKVSVYLKAMGRPMPESWQTWIG